MRKYSTSLLLLTCFTVLVFLTLSPPQAVAQENSLTTVDVPGAIETDCNAINRQGAIAGFYVDSSFVNHGFTLVSGTFKTINVPNSTGTLAYGINDNRQVVGWYTDAQGLTHGFLLTAGHFSKVDFPGSTFTNAWTINNAGTIVGTYIGADSKFHGFIDKAGTFTSFDAPNGSLLTEILGDNNHEQMVGIYFDSNSVQHGFQLQNGQFRTINFPGSGVTASDRINDSGEVVGLYGSTLSGPFSGYTRIGGVFSTVMYQKELSWPDFVNAGMIVGRYTDSSGVIHGFSGTP